MSYRHYPTPPKPISDGQVRMIYGLARKAGIDNELLHEMVRTQTGGCEHIKHLTSRQGIMIIERLQKATGDIPAEQPVPSNRSTLSQRRLMHTLAAEMGWGEDGVRLRAFLEARFGVSDVAYLTAGKASAVIEAMKAMKLSGRGERRVPGGGLDAGHQG